MQDEWVDIVKYMYNADDAAMLISRIREIARQGWEDANGAPSSKQPVSARRALERKPTRSFKLPYASFVKVSPRRET